MEHCSPTVFINRLSNCPPEISLIIAAPRSNASAATVERKVSIEK